MIKAVVFDMDGVLIDAKDWHYIALNQALDHFGFTISRNEHLTIFDGMPTREKLALLSRERGLPTKLHKFINQLKQQFTMQITHNKCYPNFIHENLLSNRKIKFLFLLDMILLLLAKLSGALIFFALYSFKKNIPIIKLEID